MQINKYRFNSFNNQTNLPNTKLRLQKMNFRQNYISDNLNTLKNNPNIKAIPNQSIKIEELNMIKPRISYTLPYNEVKAKGVNNIENEIKSQINNNIQPNLIKINIQKRSSSNIITNNSNNFNNNENNKIIVNKYKPNYKNFDNALNDNQNENFTKIPHLNFKKLQYLKRLNTDRKINEKKNDYFIDNYSKMKDINIEKRNKKLFQRNNKLVINTNSFIGDEYNEEKNKTDYNNKNDDFHNYLRMCSYFTSNHSKNKDRYESNIDIGNQTERIKSNVLLIDEKMPRIDSLKIQGRINRIRQFPNYNNEHIRDSANNNYIQNNSDYKENFSFQNDYYLINRPKKESELFANKIKRKALYDLIENNSNNNLKNKTEIIEKEKIINNNNKSLNNNQNIINGNKSYSSKIILKKNNQNSNNNILYKNNQTLKIISFDFSLYSNNKNLNKKINNDDTRKGLFIIKKGNKENITEIEINNKNIPKINKFLEEEKLIIKNSLIELKLKDEINDIKNKYKNLQDEINLLKKKSITYQEQNKNLINENEKLKKENEIFKNTIFELENEKNKLNEMIKNGNDIKDEKKNTKEKDKDNKEKKINENKNLENNNNFNKRYKRRDINNNNKGKNN